MNEKQSPFVRKFVLSLSRALEFMARAFIVKKDKKEIAVITRDGFYLSLVSDDEKNSSEKQMKDL